ncbi:MAG: hypothetical protein Q7U38_19685 [Methylobacter sp.]|nr:hypothetical protein [Methylobacter sp.]MDP2098573.1 hypothetical protein [Methylobacter sp.]MDP2428340.1 hypothetical protein [Methylobacter sp.]MDP3054051.1 hypothetical protein [Methylobacter sp.]MDP3362571.1 hypothetical protein [Methylobacter sp.]
MNQLSTANYATDVGQHKSATAHSSRGELVVKGVATTMAAALVIETGKGVMTTLAKHPLLLLGLGISAGFLTHKYRKEIILITSKTASQSKDFVLRQQENLKDLIAESQEDTAK